MLRPTAATDLVDRMVDRMIGRLRTDADKTWRRTTNGVRHLAGTDRSTLGASAKKTVWRRDNVQLWRYDSDWRPDKPALLLVHSLVSRSYVLDLRPGNSFVEALIARGYDVFLLDWGVPDAVDAGNTLETYCLEYLPRAVDAVRSTSGHESITMFGYCFGGVLSLLYAAAHPEAPLSSLAVMATPVESRQLPPLFRAPHSGRFDVEAILDENGNVPPASILAAFRALKPTADLVGTVNLLQNLWNPAFVDAHNAMTMWSRDHIPFAGAAFRQTVELTRTNALLEGGLELGDRPISLRDITVPFLNIYGLADHIVPPAAASPAGDLVGSTDRTDLALPAGHVGLIVGRAAHTRHVPAMMDWLDRHSSIDASEPEAFGSLRRKVPA
jgi:polyhydroxyalkanoate synthase